MKHPMKQALDGYDFKPHVHDHFDGAADCIECQGICRLTGADMAYTALVRTLFEWEAYSGGRIPLVTIRQLQRAGVDVGRLRLRASGTETPAESTPETQRGSATKRT
jgi:hypothetical protein